jgi:hypothetical protein
LLELVDKGIDAQEAFWALLDLGCPDLVKDHPLHLNFPDIVHALDGKLATSSRLSFFLSQQALDTGKIPPNILDEKQRLYALLLCSKWQEAEKIFDHHSLEELTNETSPLFPLYGCYLAAVEGEAIAKAHFLAANETPYPRTPTLLAHFLAGRIDLKKWRPFWFEKVELFRQMILFSHCCDEIDKVAKYRKTLQQIKYATAN